MAAARWRWHVDTQDCVPDSPVNIAACRTMRWNQGSNIVKSSPESLGRLPLPDIPLFRGLRPDAMQSLASAPRVKYRRSQTLWTAGDEARALAVILSGRVRVVRAFSLGRSAGRQYALHTEVAGGTLGEVPFFAGGSFPATAIAVEPTTCLMIDRSTLARAVAADPDLALRWLERLARRVRQLIERLEDQTERTVQQRVAALLLERHAAAAGTPFTLGSTQADVAEELGTAREVLVRALRHLREAGYVHSPARGRFVVTDARALARLA